MYIYRALNTNDLETLKMDEGLYSKYVIDQIKYRLFCYTLNSISEDNSIFKNIDSESIKELYRIFNPNYSLYINDLKNMAAKKIDKIKINYKEDVSIEKINNIIGTLKTINTHLAHGTHYNTDWISFSRNLHNIEKYYLQQTINKVAVIDSKINSIFDCGTLSINLSDYESIKKLSKLGFLITKNGSYTKAGFKGFNYSLSDKEIIYYSHVPQESIVDILEPIQIDLIYNNIFNEEFYKLNKEKKKIKYERLKKYLVMSLSKELTNIQITILHEHYLKCKSLSSLATNNEDLHKLIYAKKKLLSKIPVNHITYSIIKDKCQNIVLPEEKVYYKNL